MDGDSLVILTGAGISAESGIPTFRGKEGLWENHRPEDLATPQAFLRDPTLVWRFYNWRREIISRCSPNLAHLTLADIERQSSDFTLITQNVDALHQKAGSQKVLELHGSIWRLRCTQCENRWEDHQVPIPYPIPHCVECGANARPDVVWFGESLAQNVVEESIRVASNARTLVAIGTSAIVQPAASIPLMAKQSGAHLVEINLEATPLTPYVDKLFRGPATREVIRWWKEVTEDTSMSSLHMD